MQRVVVLTGAGVSAESGLQTFRDADGLWEGLDPMEIATPQAFAANPELVYRFYNDRRRQLDTVEPNDAHAALARLQREFAGRVFLLTQNVDDLHERAGSVQVCHMHGQLRNQLCSYCGSRTPVVSDLSARMRCAQCQQAGGLRPDVVWFGEIPYHLEDIASEIACCDLFIAAGTSGAVYPAAGFVREARHAGALTAEINLQLSEVSGYFHEQRQGPATREVTAMVDALLNASG
ncbi:MAG: NAD-dependent deacylase [Halioglobus sp.]|nr:NAD-dependent deacylase [Halioglobus sp.]